MTEAAKLGLSYENLASAVAACLLFDVKEDPEAVKLQQMITEGGVSQVLKEVCKLDPESDMARVINEKYNEFKERYGK